MFHKLMAFLRRTLSFEAGTHHSTPLTLPGRSGLIDAEQHQHQPLTLEHAASLTPHDETLLERARSQWQAGDWQSLAALTHDHIEHHPERSRLALLAAAGRAQLGDTNGARQFIHQAEAWGCSKRQIARILISGTYISLGRAALAAQQELRGVGLSG